MKSLSGVGLGLSLVFGCLLLALVLELCYMLWWKKRGLNRHRSQQQVIEDAEEDEDKYSSSSRSARELLNMFCCKKPSSLSCSALALNPQQICASVRIRETPQQSNNNKDLLLIGEDGFLSLTGPPRFLFTIKEETLEDLESEDGRPVRSRKGSTSLNELLLSVECQTPYLTPLPSPPYLTPPITPTNYNGGFNFDPFPESSTDAEISRIRASPPPKFKFLQVAEEKFLRRNQMVEEGDDDEHNKPAPSSQDSFITIVIGKHSNDEAQHHQQFSTSSSPMTPIKR